MGQAIVTFDMQHVLDVLKFPRGTKIVSLGDIAWPLTHVSILIEHPELPSVAEGAAPRVVHPQIKTVMRDSLEFAGWGL